MAVWPASAGERLTLHVSPSVAFAPADLVVRTTVQADARNRAITIVAESEDFYRASEVQLDGDKAPRSTTFEFRSLPSGNYQVTATLLGADDQPLTYVRSEMNVISKGR
jgi:hypothetical protein